MTKTTTAKRLHQIMDERRITQSDIIRMAEPYCKEFGVKLNKSDLSQYCSGKVEPLQNKLFILAKALNVTPVWLMGYDEGAPTTEDLTITEIALINSFREMEETSREYIMYIVRHELEMQQKSRLSRREHSGIKERDK